MASRAILPADAVLMVDELPHTATGKLNKLALRQRWGEHLVTARPEPAPRHIDVVGPVPPR